MASWARVSGCTLKRIWRVLLTTTWGTWNCSSPAQLLDDGQSSSVWWLWDETCCSHAKCADCALALNTGWEAQSDHSYTFILHGYHSHDQGRVLKQQRIAHWFGWHHLLKDFCTGWHLDEIHVHCYSCACRLVEFVCIPHCDCRCFLHCILCMALCIVSWQIGNWCQ